MQVRAAVVMAGMTLALSSCVAPPDFILINMTAQSVQVEIWRGSMWRHHRTVPSGEASGRIPIDARQRISVGKCTYSYPSLTWEALNAARPANVRMPSEAFQFRLEEDFSIHVFPLNPDGSSLPEAMVAGLPAKPEIACKDR